PGAHRRDPRSRPPHRHCIRPRMVAPVPRVHIRRYSSLRRTRNGRLLRVCGLRPRNRVRVGHQPHGLPRLGRSQRPCPAHRTAEVHPYNPPPSERHYLRRLVATRTTRRALTAQRSPSASARPTRLDGSDRSERYKDQASGVAIAPGRRMDGSSEISRRHRVAPRVPSSLRATASPPAPSTTAAARAFDAVKVYGSGDTAVRALDGVTVEFPASRDAGIMGPSGAGKSTLMHCVAGLDDLTSGQVWIGDTELGSLSDKARTLLRRRQIGFVFQAYNLIPTLTAEENITLPLGLAGDKPEPAWLDNVIETVGLGDRLAHRPSELSGGQQQRVAVARALVSQPAIIFADEPTGNPHSPAGAEILEFMRRAVDELNQTIVMVTHDPNAASYSDKVLFLADGRIVDEMADPTAERVLDRRKGFGDCPWS